MDLEDASRPAGECEDTETQTAQMEVDDLSQYRCLYQRVRLSYSATMITDPVPNKTGADNNANQEGAEDPSPGR